MTRVFVDRRYIAYRPPFHVESFKTGLHIGCDAGGLSCVRFEAKPLAYGAGDLAVMERAVATLNETPVSDFIVADIADDLEPIACGDQACTPT